MVEICSVDSRESREIGRKIAKATSERGTKTNPVKRTPMIVEEIRPAWSKEFIFEICGMVREGLD